jgi:hypothetical protein
MFNVAASDAGRKSAAEVANVELFIVVLYQFDFTHFHMNSQKRVNIMCYKHFVLNLLF